MKWTVKFYNKFELEFGELETEVQDELLAHAVFLGKFGPQLGRPYVDTLKGSKHSDMKELRFKAAMGSGGCFCLMTLKEKLFCWSQAINLE